MQCLLFKVGGAGTYVFHALYNACPKTLLFLCNLSLRYYVRNGLILKMRNKKPHV